MRQIHFIQSFSWVQLSLDRVASYIQRSTSLCFMRRSWHCWLRFIRVSLRLEFSKTHGNNQAEFEQIWTISTISISRCICMRIFYPGFSFPPSSTSHYYLDRCSPSSMSLYHSRQIKSVLVKFNHPQIQFSRFMWKDEVVSSGWCWTMWTHKHLKASSYLPSIPGRPRTGCKETKQTSGRRL